MRPAILNLKLISLIVLVVTVFSCGNRNSKETCLKYSTSFIDKEAQRLIIKINKYHENNLNHPIALNAKVEMDSIEAEYLMLSKSISTNEDIDFCIKSLEHFYLLINRKVKNIKQAKVYVDSLHMITVNTKAEILNIASLINYEALNSLTYPFQYGCVYLDSFGYNFYSSSDTIKLSEPFNAFIAYEISSTRNIEYKDYKVLGMKRNGKKLNKLDIRLASKNRMIIVKPEQKGDYELNLLFTRINDYQPYKTEHPLQIKFTVTE